MSTQTSKDVSCPHCGAAVKTEMWPGINAQDSPELRERLLDETLFDWTCPRCGYRARLLYPCLYHDRDRGFMVYLAPSGNPCELEAVDISGKFPRLSSVKKRVTATLPGLKEKILIFEAGLDDYAVELVKLALTDVMNEKYGKQVENCYFCYVDEAEDRIGFSFLFEGEEDPVRRGTRFDAYEKSLEIVASAGLPEQDPAFLSVEADAARRILEEYRERQD